MSRVALQQQARHLPGIEKASIIERAGHSISRRNISRSALKVLSVLARGGFHGFLVGGGVRDLLLGGHPKDFDVATDATPEQVRGLFRKSRIVGRRFKIVHIRFGYEIIEVTTFRAHHKVSTRLEANQPRQQIAGLDSAHASSGMILRDNVYGPIDEDAMRRDFTVNALYYTTDGFRLYDFCGGLEDLQARRLRIIGDPEARYTEDPVRMLRAIRFAAKLDFSMEPATEAPINLLSHLLGEISPARLYDESLKLLVAGHARRTWQLLCDYEAAKYLFGPTLRATLDPQTSASKVVLLALRNTDIRIASGKPVSPAFLYAALLWPVLRQKLLQRCGAGTDTDQTGLAGVNTMHLEIAANEVLAQQVAHTAIPRRFTMGTRDIWMAQKWLEKPSSGQAQRRLQQPRFRAAYDFLLLRNESGENLQQQCDWWTDYQAKQPQWITRTAAARRMGRAGMARHTRAAERG